MSIFSHIQTALRPACSRLLAPLKGLVWMAAACLMLVGTACVREEQLSDTPSDNFEALWKIIDEQYCFLQYKQEAIGLDWDAVHERYRQRISPAMSRTQLFEVLAAMLAELRDGHVNLYAAHDLGRNWSWYEDYPPNFYADLQDAYFGTDYRIAASMRYRILPDNIGYVACPSFASAMGEGNLDELFWYLRTCNGLILDLRDNSGGDLVNAERLAARFTNGRLHVGYICHKNGRAHNAFSKPEPEYLEPSTGVRWQKRAIVLTNRHCYSAANTFVRDVKCCPLVIVVGDQTGGGSGMPFSSELPNGWSVRFSACPMFDTQMRHIEFGIQPDIAVALTESDRARGRDTLIETARQLLSSPE